jgi:hypothetical protein
MTSELEAIKRSFQTSTETLRDKYKQISHEKSRSQKVTDRLHRETSVLCTQLRNDLVSSFALRESDVEFAKTRLPVGSCYELLVILITARFIKVLP